MKSIQDSDTKSSRQTVVVTIAQNNLMGFVCKLAESLIMIMLL